MYTSSRICAAALLWLACGLASAQQEIEITPDTVLVRYGDVEVTYRDFKARMAGLPEDIRRQVANDPQRIARILTGIGQQRLLAREARAAGLDKEPLIAAKMLLKTEQVLAQEQLDAVAAGASSPDVELMAREYYLTHKQEFVLPDQITFRQILVGTQERGDEEALRRAQYVYQQALKGDATFTELVAQYSDDPSAERNQGRVAGVERGQLVPPFEKVAFALDQGEISEPVKTRFGYHVIELLSHRPETLQGFEKVRDQIIERMGKAHRQRIIDEYVEDLRAANPQQADKDVIQALRAIYYINWNAIAHGRQPGEQSNAEGQDKAQQ